jgi:hypothetical protein
MPNLVNDKECDLRDLELKIDGNKRYEEIIFL